MLQWFKNLFKKADPVYLPSPEIHRDIVGFSLDQLVEENQRLGRITDEVRARRMSVNESIRAHLESKET